ncbi:MAG TPA: hypothetical protein VNJ04_05090 [Gemmatimonadaceae bacterium]|nr:hypothetical protein [Gemmatimonadaceae bacterium]
MRASVRAAFVWFTTPMEGCVPWMYTDVKGLVTTAIGNLIDPIQYALPLPWVHEDGTPATRAEIAAEWYRVKSDPVAARRGHRYTEGITDLRLTSEGIDQVVSQKLDEMDRYLTSRFPEYPDWPADAQLATLSMSWACGPGFRFPALDACLRDRDFDGAARHCTIQTVGNPGVIPRNLANRRLYANAVRVQAFHLDPNVLMWPKTVEDAIDTVPELPPNSTPLPLINTPIQGTIYPRPLPEEVTGSGPTLHADPAIYFLERDPDEPDSA